MTACVTRFVVDAAAGHFIVICGYSATDHVVYYKNPASRKGLRHYAVHLYLMSALMLHVVICFEVFFIEFVSIIKLPSVLWHCWMSVRQSIWPVNVEWWGVGVVICLEWGADCLHMVQLMPLPSQNPHNLLPHLNPRQVFFILVLTNPACFGKETNKQV